MKEFLGAWYRLRDYARYTQINLTAQSIYKCRTEIRERKLPFPIFLYGPYVLGLNITATLLLFLAAKKHILHQVYRVPLKLIVFWLSGSCEISFL